MRKEHEVCLDRRRGHQKHLSSHFPVPTREVSSRLFSRFAASTKPAISTAWRRSHQHWQEQHARRQPRSLRRVPRIGVRRVPRRRSAGGLRTHTSRGRSRSTWIISNIPRICGTVKRSWEPQRRILLRCVILNLHSTWMRCGYRRTLYDTIVVWTGRVTTEETNSNATPAHFAIVGSTKPLWHKIYRRKCQSSVNRDDPANAVA